MSDVEKVLRGIRVAIWVQAALLYAIALLLLLAYFKLGHIHEHVFGIYLEMPR